MDRRTFIQTLGLFSGAALLQSCTGEEGQNKLISTLVPPDDGVTPGEARWIVSTCSECSARCGIRIRVREGNPVKLEGIPGHPVSTGGLCMRGQASLWRRYHPERLKQPMERTADGTFRPVTWEAAFSRIVDELGKSRENGRDDVWLSGRTTGSLAGLIDSSCSRLGIERLPEFEIFSHGALRRANHLLFGRGEIPDYRIERADLVLSLGADLLETFLNPVGFTRRFADRAKEEGQRWIHLEPHCSLTGANADLRLSIRPASEPVLLAWLLQRLARNERLPRRLPEGLISGLPSLTVAKVSERTGLPAGRLEKIADALASARSPLVLTGGTGTGSEDGLAAAVLTGLLQWGTDQIGGTVDFSGAFDFSRVGTLNHMQRLTDRLNAEEIGVLFMSRTDPVYHLPPSLGFAEAMGRAGFKVALTDFLDETGKECDLILPLSHSIESWGDTRPQRGVHTLIQPAAPPLHDTLSEGEILLRLGNEASGSSVSTDYREYLFGRWREQFSEKELNDFSGNGYLTFPSPAPDISLNGENALAFIQQWRPATAPDEPVLVISPSIRTYDGRSRVIPLLSEVPDPLTTISYGSWVSISKQDAARLNLADRDRVRLSVGDWSSTLPVKLQPGLAEGVLGLQWGLSETLPLAVEGQSGEVIVIAGEVQVEKAPGAARLPILSGSFSQHGRGIIPDPVRRKEKKHHRFSLYPEHDHPGYSWGMVIDLDRCVGCGACTAACYIENNVPVTGPEDHLKGREMSWLRIEPFYDEEGRVEFSPMLCQHCHNAPCEPVCPVYAAYHNPEGLNVQVYQRCVGTRYCANNCPYKVRRFNWWEHERPEPLDRMLNPDLSARSRGIMEKCTFCIQRIRTARDKARDEGRRIEDGEVMPACAQSCPAGAIRFGNLADETHEVSKIVGSGSHHRIFEELGTDTAIYYLKKPVRSEE
ncbi:MAG: 4Fe-4S dicluster domain-containing protein [Desulfuromonadales bacterium]